MSQTDPLSRRIGSPRYTLSRDQLEETYTIVRTETFGPFASREEARQFMLDTTAERQEADRAPA